MDVHDPITCEHLKLWKMKCDDDSETSNWIHVNTKVGKHDVMIRKGFYILCRSVLNVMQQLRKTAAVITWSAGITHVDLSFAGYASVRGNLMGQAGGHLL